MTTLLVDLGNTALKWTTIDCPNESKTYVHHGRDQIPYELENEWMKLGPTRVAGCMVSSERLALNLIKLCNKHRIKWDWLHSEKTFKGNFELINCYDDFQQLGSDRWYAALGAASLYPDSPLLVAHMGTATTVDIVVPEKGKMYFRGGRIIPGPTMMVDSLLKGTRCKPDGLGVRVDFPLNTANAINTGIVEAHLGVIDRAIKTISGLAAQPRILFAGGAAPLLAPYILREYPQAVMQHNLVLRGLALRAKDDL